METVSEKLGKWNTSKTKTVEVYLDKNADTTKQPAVQVDEVIWGRPNMKFIKDGDGDDFDFESLEFTKKTAPFTKPVITGSKDVVNVTNKGDEGEWHYKITVKSGGDTYDTALVSPPGGDRPVIRN